jgi:hypothetical protein
MLPLLQLVAIFCTAVFAGAAIYINLVEHPARMSCGTSGALAQWAPSYRRATRMQAPLALVAFLAAVTAWAMGAGMAWLIAGLLIGAVIPFTLIVIKPTNDKLLAPDRDGATADTGQLLDRWARLHAVRSGLSLVALAILLWQLTR